MSSQMIFLVLIEILVLWRLLVVQSSSARYESCGRWAGLPDSAARFTHGHCSFAIASQRGKDKLRIVSRMMLMLTSQLALVQGSRSASPSERVSARSLHSPPDSMGRSKYGRYLHQILQVGKERH